MMKTVPALTLTLVCASVAARTETPLRDTLQTDRINPIGTVVVTGTRAGTDIRQLPMTISVVDRRKIESDRQPSLLPTLARQVPGLFVTGRSTMGYGVSTGSSGAMTMRGIGNGTQGTPTTGMLVLIDGNPQYMGLMGHPIADAYQSMLAERVEVVRGPASVLYGSNAMGGVINIVTRKMHEDGVKTDLKAAYGSYNTLHAEASNRVRAGRFYSIVTGSYDRSDGNRPNMGFGQYGGMVKLGCDISKAWSIAADANITHFDASNAGPVTAPIIDNDSHITRGKAALSLRNEYKRSSGVLNLFCNWGRHKINDGYSAGEQPLDYRFNSRDRMLGVTWYQSVELFAGNRLTAGVDFLHFGGRAWNRYLATGEDRLSADKTQNEIAGYIDLRQSFGRWLTLDAGLRVDHHSHVGTEWVPQAGVTVRIARNAELKAMASKGFRFPTIREMYMFPPQNPDLKPERLMNYELSFSQRLAGGALSYSVCIYYIKGRNMITRQLIDGRPKYVNVAEVRNCGIECEMSYRIGDAWSVESNYSWLDMKYPVVAAPEHKFYGGAAWTFRRWSVSTGIQYISGLYTSVAPKEVENFVLWDVDLSFRIACGVNLYVRGENLLAQRYQINSGYPMPRATVTGGVNVQF